VKRPRTTAAVHVEKRRGHSGRRWWSTGRRSGALTDDGGALVEVGGALLDDGGVVGGVARSGRTAAALSGKFWQRDGVVSFCAELRKFSECNCYI
jgi:hypothetical protein